MRLRNSKMKMWVDIYGCDLHSLFILYSFHSSIISYEKPTHRVIHVVRFFFSFVLSHNTCVLEKDKLKYDVLRPPSPSKFFFSPEHSILLKFLLNMYLTIDSSQ